MRAPLRLVLLVCIGSPSILRAQIPAAGDSVTALFARLIADRTVAAKHADTAAYRRLIDPAAVYLNDDGSRENADQHIRHILKRGDELEHTRWVNDSMHVYVTGDLAFIDYHVLQHRHFGPRDFTWPYGCMDTYVRRSGRWLLLRHAETHAVALPTSQAIDARVLDEYVGRYEWWPGYRDVISRHDNQLFDQGTGDEKAVLNHAATPEAFYVAGDASLIVFIRDKTGRVVGYVLHWPDGQVTRARELPDPPRARHGES